MVSSNLWKRKIYIYICIYRWLHCRCTFVAGHLCACVCQCAPGSMRVFTRTHARVTVSVCKLDSLCPAACIVLIPVVLHLPCRKKDSISSPHWPIWLVKTKKACIGLSRRPRKNSLCIARCTTVSSYVFGPPPSHALTPFASIHTRIPHTNK